MALSCPAEVDLTRLRNSVHLIYARVALDPSGAFSFHRGAEYAVRWLGYHETKVRSLPEEVTSCFAGVGNPHAIARLRPGEVVADLGCGSGTDLLLAAGGIGAHGCAIGIDTNESMRERAERGARRGGFTNTHIRYGDVVDLPLRAASVDVILSNGVLHLVPQKERAIAEMARVLRPGGRLQLADVAVARELPETARCDVDLWASGSAGALPAIELVRALEAGGFRAVRVTARFDCFAGSSIEPLTRQHGPEGVNIFAVRR